MVNKIKPSVVCHIFLAGTLHDPKIRSTIGRPRGAFERTLNFQLISEKENRDGDPR